jgi:putative nucleotidyltransferase with HDIG domain
LTRLIARCPIQHISARRVLFREGDAGDALYVILSGRVELSHSLDCAPLEDCTLNTGQYFGEMALLDDLPRSDTARALSDCILLEVRKQDLFELAAEHPQLIHDMVRVLSARLREEKEQQIAAMAREKLELEGSNRRLRANYDATLEALSSALDLRDQATQGHSQRVTAYTLLIAEAMGVPNEEQEALRLGALLHDIGKIGVSDAILHKPATLTPNEWAVMKKHPEWGAAIIARVEFLREARDIVLSHHEKFDGSGYPRGLKGAVIPLGARIFAVADVFDAVTTFRPYRMPMSTQDAVALIRRESGRHFDPEIVAAFEKALPQMLEVMRASFAEE